MELLFWILVFAASLGVLIKGADWLLHAAEKVGLSFGLSPFIVGVTIVGVGTSLPELISSIAAVIGGVPEVVAANVIGSNIANILLIVGISALVAKKLFVSKNLIDLDLPLLAISTGLLLGVVWDAQVTFIESVILLCAYGVYLLYTVIHVEEVEGEEVEVAHTPAAKVGWRDAGLLVLGAVGLMFGATYLIESVTALSVLLGVGAGVIAITAVAVGTSLPELLVSVKAALRGNSEVALGNIFGSNVFNALVVLGFPGLFAVLPLDAQTYALGVPALALVTLLFVISGISRRIHVWEGALYLLLYVLFVAKLFNLA